MENSEPNKKKVVTCDSPKREPKLIVTIPPGRGRVHTFPMYREIQARLKAGEKFIIFDNMSDFLGNENFWKQGSKWMR